MENNNLSTGERLALLEKPLWNYKDIVSYFSINKNKAIDIKRAARTRNDGKPEYDPTKATVDAIFDVMGLDINIEIARLKHIQERNGHAFAGSDECDA